MKNGFLCKDNVYLCRDNVYLCRDNVYLCRDNIYFCRDYVYLCRDIKYRIFFLSVEYILLYENSFSLINMLYNVLYIVQLQ